MLFTSYGFIGFLILCCVLYYVVPMRLRWVVLLLGSLCFYCFSGVKNLIFVAVTVFTVWYTARKLFAIENERKQYLALHKGELTQEEKKAIKKKSEKKRLYWMTACTALNVGLLFALKVLSAKGSLLLPLGISFYTLIILGYLIDVYRGKYEPQDNIARLALFTTFFPQVVQGPINRYDDMGDLFVGHGLDFGNIKDGVLRILWGFFKKLVIADRLLPAVKAIVAGSDEYAGIYVLLCMIFYATQLYADFTGGIDISIGAAKLFGITIKENFRYPFLSETLSEYWRRWHISLGKWFTDYVFYPISVCGPVKKLSKLAKEKAGASFGRKLPVYVSSLSVWFLTGLWHGTGLNFIVWGLANGIIIMISDEIKPFLTKVRLPRILRIIRTLFITSSLRLLDLYRDVPKTAGLIWSMFARPGFSGLTADKLLSLGLDVKDYAVLFAGVVLMLIYSLLDRKESVQERLERKGPAAVAAAAVCIFTLTVVFGVYGIGYDASQFIYNQF